MARNYNYAKLENGALKYAPVPLVIDGENVWTNVESVYLENGYCKVIRTASPVKDGHYYTTYWEMEGAEIVQKWEEHEEPAHEEDEEPTAEELLKILAGVSE